MTEEEIKEETLRYLDYLYNGLDMVNINNRVVYLTAIARYAKTYEEKLRRKNLILKKDKNE